MGSMVVGILASALCIGLTSPTLEVSLIPCLFCHYRSAKKSYGPMPSHAVSYPLSPQLLLLVA